MFTGCDSLMVLMLESGAFCSAFMALDSGWEVPDVEKFVCAVHGRKYSAGVNAAMYNLFRLTMW